MTNATPSDSVSVLITDSALESLALYHRTSPDHAQRVEKVVASLRRAEIAGRVVKLAGAGRPVWQCDVDGDKCVYLTIGQGAHDVEARISFFGPPLPDTSESYKELLVLSGEAKQSALPETIRIEDSRPVANVPLLPQRPAEKTLDAYLEPTEDELLVAIDRQPPMDDLNGRPFRYLRDVRAPIDLPPRLSPEQGEMLTRPRPMFLQGVAGSGKTTLLTHFAHQELVLSRNAASILMIAYTDALKQFIQRLLGSLRNVDDADLPRVEVCTWRELCESLAVRLGLAPFQWAAAAQFANFARGLLPPMTGDAPVDLIPELEELVRSVIKGETSDVGVSLIERDAFLTQPAMGLDRYIERTKVYEIAQQYQYFLNCGGLCDDLDAARLLLHHRHEFPRYDFVLVDETQDYTLTQLRLMAALAKEPEGLFFAGDMDQVVYPSQFNWEKVRRAVYHVWRKAPPPRQRIRYNYRNPQPVSRMGEALLQIKREALEIERDSDDETLSNQAATPVPIRIQVTRDEADEIIRQLAVQVGSLGVIQESEQHLDIEGIEFQRTFTPRTVKGLEFNVVCLVGYNALYRDLPGGTRRKLTPRQTLLMSNEVYVSVTRTRGQLLLIDENPRAAGLWDAPELSDFITEMEGVREVVKLVAARYKLSSRHEWRVSALDFEAQQAWGPAGECWERAGVPASAAAAYERGGLLKKAQSLYKALGDRKSAARMAEELGDYAEAARLYATEQQWARAAACWSEAANYGSAADAYLKCGDTREAAVCYARANKYAEAANCFETIESWLDAAQQWVAARKLLDASRCYDRAGRKKQAGELAARHWEQAGEFVIAANEWQKLRNVEEACRCWEAAGNPGEAQKLFHAAGKLIDSARLLSDMGRHREAGDEYKAAGSMNKAAIEYQEAQAWSAAGEAWAACSSLKDAIACYERAGDWPTVGRLRLRDGNYRKGAEAFERGGDFASAARAWAATQDAPRAAASFERVKDWRSAGAQWERAGNRPKAAGCYRRAGDHARAEEVLRPAPVSLVLPMPRIPAVARAPAVPPQPLVPIPPPAWPYTIPGTRQNRAFLETVKAASELGGSLIGIRESILIRLSDPHRPGLPALQDAENMLSLALGRFTPDANVSSRMRGQPSRYARLFESAGRFDLAGTLWEQAGKQADAVRCYLRLGRRDLAAEVIRKIGNPEMAAKEFTNAGLHLEAALCFIDADLCLRASTSLDLAGFTRAATIAKAVHFERNGNAQAAKVVWESLGCTATKEELREAVQRFIAQKSSAASDVRTEGFIVAAFRELMAAIRRTFRGT